jgi:hypothetical protein
VPPFKTALIVFAATQVVSVPLGHGVIVAAVVGGGCVAYNHLPERLRASVDSRYARVKQLLRERFARASFRTQHTTRRVVVRVQQFVTNGILIVLIWTAFAGESWRQFVETIRATFEVCSGKSVFAEAA